MIGFGQNPSVPTCSRAGCSADATWNVNWRNPKIHTIDRVKVWLACDEHRDFLYDFLDARSFPVAITPVGVVVESLADAPVEGTE
ncbi:MAG: hypothetical protein ABWX59_09385 [Microbacteriaceae bacterium]